MIVMTAIITSVFLMVKCTGSGRKDHPAPEKGFSAYAGVEKCSACHKDIFDSHIQTAHYLTNQPATENFIMGSFEKGKNTYSYSPLIAVNMEKRDSGYYQVVYYKGEEKKAMRFDMTIGSGVLGQSFLSWQGNKLNQLPITFFTAANKWSNSPGFPNDKVGLNRVIVSRCLECHLTYAEGVEGTPLEQVAFDRKNMVLGITCEKCHGPAAKHVEFHTKNPLDTLAKFIVKTGSFSRQQQLDMCALCHAGNIINTKPSFEFMAGDKLTDFFSDSSLNETAVSTGNVDVHGNQYGLLKASKCFIKTQTLSCNSCHDTHKKERGNLEVFSQRCMNCHKTTAPEFKNPVHNAITAIEKNCIDCHMPAMPSRAIVVFVEGEGLPRTSLLRTHFISVYPDETNKFKSKQK